jgi:deoxyribose-phosphate aldolase
MRHLPAVDRVGVDRRAAALASRSIKAEAQAQAIRMAIGMIDLTTLEGQDTPGKVRQLAAKAVCPAPAHPEVPSCAALCVYPARVPEARDALAGTGVKVASVSTGFPAGQTSLELRLEETRDAVAAGAEEIDMVISR